jgi:hypothetical protein
VNRSESTKKIVAIAGKYGFKLIRSKKHLVFRNDSGVQLVTAASPIDHRAFKNIETIIKKLLNKHDSNHAG